MKSLEDNNLKTKWKKATKELKKVKENEAKIECEKLKINRAKENEFEPKPQETLVDEGNNNNIETDRLTLRKTSISSNSPPIRTFNYTA